MTPHIAGLTVEAMRDLALSAANQINPGTAGRAPALSSQPGSVGRPATACNDVFNMDNRKEVGMASEPTYDPIGR